MDRCFVFLGALGLAVTILGGCATHHGHAPESNVTLEDDFKVIGHTRGRVKSIKIFGFGFDGNLYEKARRRALDRVDVTENNRTVINWTFDDETWYILFVFRSRNVVASGEVVAYQ